ncbi:cytochrome P450 [Colletotrichum navitas]|uniref:Cytochrome P450 n=1 Tax=Colletotrichum navitas TaxID=681940 RepID=A0AAD8PIC0_9PEZI|nr:cytochrome P450 [Colletotrichum navitas]KAK1561457.1 cytochrome P450 [Colletotrichum navitas]
MTTATHPLPGAGGALDIQTLSQWPGAALGLAFVVLALLMQRWLTSDPLANVPVMGKGGKWARRKEFFLGKGPDFYKEGYKQFKDSIFRVTEDKDDDVVYVPPKYMTELAKASNSGFDLEEYLDEHFQVKYTKSEHFHGHMINAVKTKLTPSLSQLNPTILDEVNEAMRLELPQSDRWTEINISPKLFRVIAMISGRIFVGPELCRDERYLDAAINYTIDIGTAAYGVTQVPEFLRPFIARWLPTTKSFHQRIADAEAVFRPLISARKEAAKEPNYQAPNDLLQWMIDGKGKYSNPDVATLTKGQLAATFAAIHTTTLSALNALYWLAAKPEMAVMLRDDIQQALLESGGLFTSLALQNMGKLDSFLKESMRMNPISAASVQRKTTKTVKLPNGQTIPKGRFVGVSLVGLNSDPDIFPDPHVFDPLRFYKLREAKDPQAHLVSVSPTNLAFGFGRHACPGRFFAANEIKMIVANLVLNYDVCLPDGVTERYKNLVQGLTFIPDPEKTIMMRKV